MASWVARQGFDVAAVEAMKPRVQAIEAETRAAFPDKGLSDEGKHSRSAILSALGTLGSADHRRLNNPDYAETVRDAIELTVVGAKSASAQNDAIQNSVRGKVSHDRAIMAGLAQLEAAVMLNQSAAAHR